MVAAATAAALVAGRQAAAGERVHRIAVHVVNDALVDPLDLAKAEHEAQLIYEAAGVRITWVAGMAESGHAAAAMDVRVILLDGKMSEQKIRKDRVGDHVLGQAAHGTSRAAIFTSRVEAIALTIGSCFTRVLGRVMAHEIGHLVLPPNSHSATGIMRESVDFRANVRQRFTIEQVALIQAALEDGDGTNRVGAN
jgi:hypothetical protein